jgi:hypothetical protein
MSVSQKQRWVSGVLRPYAPEKNINPATNHCAFYIKTSGTGRVKPEGIRGMYLVICTCLIMTMSWYFCTLAAGRIRQMPGGYSSGLYRMVVLGMTPFLVVRRYHPWCFIAFLKNPGRTGAFPGSYLPADGGMTCAYTGKPALTTYECSPGFHSRRSPAINPDRYYDPISSAKGRCRGTGTVPSVI